MSACAVQHVPKKVEVPVQILGIRDVNNGFDLEQKVGQPAAGLIVRFNH